MREFQEGMARFCAPEGEINRKLPVFFNPVMKLNRDVAVWVAGKLKLKDACCPMSGSGVRAVRLAMEAGMEVTANDINPLAAELARNNARLNKVDVKVENKDANVLLRESVYDYVDIDPFGSPMPFADSAINALKNDSVLAVTATDLACLLGHFSNTCKRKYLATSLRCGFSKELGLRILIKRVQEQGALYSKALLPILSHSTGHYFRVYLKCKKGKKKCDDILKMHKVIHYNSKTQEFSFNMEDGVRAGPLWAGELWDSELCSDFGLIEHVAEESGVGAVGFYNVPYIAKKLNIKQTRKISDIIDDIRSRGFDASRTHLDFQGIRTNMPARDVVRILSP